MKQAEGMSIIVKTITRIMVPLMLVMAAYIVIGGHLTHGGGFPGGVLIASTLLLLILAFSLDFVEGKVSFKFGEHFRGFGALAIIIIASIGLLFGSWLFKNIGVYPAGVPGSVFSGGSLPLLNIAEMANVSACFLTAFYFLVRKRKGGK